MYPIPIRLWMKGPICQDPTLHSAFEFFPRLDFLPVMWLLSLIDV